MYLFKALYIRAYFVTALVMTFWCLSQLGQGKWLWLSPLLVWSPLWLHNTWRMQVANSAYQDDREKLSMSLALIGVGIMLVVGERGHILWWTLAGLFALLLYVFLISKLTYGVREIKGDKNLLPQLIVSRHPGARLVAGAQLVVFFHAASCPYAKMAMRELLAVLKTEEAVLKPEQVIAVFADEVPQWARKFQQAGGHCWVDTDGEACQQLGLWLRGGNALLEGGYNALRPALAVINDAGQVGFWEVAKNFRLPPSLHTHWERVRRVL